MLKIVQVKTGKVSRVMSYNCGDFDLKPGDLCVVSADRGKDCGKVVSTPKIVELFETEKDIKKVIRKVTDNDVRQLEMNEKDAKRAYKICEEKIAKSGLKMKLIDVEYTFDKNKIICYFTADSRVDFRELVKNLASSFKIRIELRQIGVRDEAKIVNGYGRCGRRLCCGCFAKEFEPVTIRMAKYQRLPLNPSKISGLCGRLICCLAYEYENYRELSKNIPPEGSEVLIEEGKGIVLDINVIKQILTIELEENKNRVEVPLNKIKKVIKESDHFKILEKDDPKNNLDSDEIVDEEPS